MGMGDTIQRALAEKEKKGARVWLVWLFRFGKRQPGIEFTGFRRRREKGFNSERLDKRKNT